MAGLRTEYPFVLHKGYVDADGEVHTRGVMRLATARDEIEPLRDPRVGGPDDPLLTIIVLSRVIIELGTLTHVTPKEIEGLFAADLAYLQDFYGIVNFGSPDDIRVLLEEQRDRATASPAGSPPTMPAPDPETGQVTLTPADFVDGDPIAVGGPESDGSTRSRRRAAVEEVRSPEQ